MGVLDSCGPCELRTLSKVPIGLRAAETARGTRRKSLWIDRSIDRAFEKPTPFVPRERERERERALRVLCFGERENSLCFSMWVGDGRHGPDSRPIGSRRARAGVLLATRDPRAHGRRRVRRGRREPANPAPVRERLCWAILRVVGLKSVSQTL